MMEGKRLAYLLVSIRGRGGGELLEGSSRGMGGADMATLSLWFFCGVVVLVVVVVVVGGTVVDLLHHDDMDADDVALAPDQRRRRIAILPQFAHAGSRNSSLRIRTLLFLVSLF